MWCQLEESSVNEYTYCMTKVDEGVPPDHADEVEQHDSREEVLGLKLEGKEQDTKFSGRILHAERTQDAKERTTRATTTDENFWYCACVPRKDSRPVLCESRQHTRRQEKGNCVVCVALEQPRVPYRQHEVPRSPHVEQEMRWSRVNEHGCEVGVADVAGGNMPERIPKSRQNETSEMDGGVRGNDTAAELRNRVLLLPPFRGQFSWCRRSTRLYGPLWRLEPSFRVF
jgi:hypothetical protein